MSNTSLCRTWKNSALNECGVFLNNMLTFESTDNNNIIDIHCALKYPKVYVDFTLENKNVHRGSFPSLDSMNFDVHDSAQDVMQLVAHAIEERSKTCRLPKNLINNALDKMRQAITDVSIDSIDMKETIDELEKNCFPVCKTCGEECITLLDNGNCVECDYKIKHPEAQKKYCSKCIHFRNHDLYDEKDHTECCCKLHLEGKNDDEWSYLSIDNENKKLIEYARYRKAYVKCEECGNKSKFIYSGLCLQCYEKKLEKANEIKCGFEAEGWKEVPESERENAISENGWINERNMNSMEPRKGTRFFIIDIIQLKWSFYFKTQPGEKLKWVSKKK